jgi:hypothetical protein
VGAGVGGVAQGVGSEFKPQNRKKKKEKKKSLAGDVAQGIRGPV